MATNPLNSNTSTSQEFETTQPEICLPFHEAITKLPIFLLSDDEQEQNEFAIFLSQVDQLHKPVGKVSARSILNYLQHMLKPPTQTFEGSSQESQVVTFPEQLPQLTGNIATEIASCVINNIDIHNTTISVLDVLKEFSWETKVALMATTFVLTFGDKGSNLSEASKLSANEIELFAEVKRGSSKNQLRGNTHNFGVVVDLIVSIIDFESLPMTYMTSKDAKVKAERTNLLSAVYWIIRIFVLGAISHITKISRRRHEFDRVISTLWETHSRWSKKLEELRDNGHLKTTLGHLQELLKGDVDVEVYNNIKKVLADENHSDNMDVLNVLISSNREDEPPLYDCHNKKKVHINKLRSEYVLLFISGLETFAPAVDESKLVEFFDNLDANRGNQIECNIVWIPVVDLSLQRTDATEKSMLKPFLDWYYLVRYMKFIHEDDETEMRFKGCYSIYDLSMISNEVKKFLMDDWKYKCEPIIVVLDPQGNVVHLNAIHAYYVFGLEAFPFTKKREEELLLRLAMGRWLSPLKRDLAMARLLTPLVRDLGQLYDNWMIEMKKEFILWYGGGDMEWIRSVTGMVPGIARELGRPIHMVHVGEMMMSLDEEVVGSVKEEKLCRHHCISDPILLFLFWNRLHSYVYSNVYAGHATNWNTRSAAYQWVQDAQRWLNYDKSNVGWAILESRYDLSSPKHGKVVLSTLKEFNMWKEDLKNTWFYNVFVDHCDKLHKRIFGEYYSIEFSSAALMKDQPPIHPKCEECGRKMKEYTTLVCYHGRGRGRGRGGTTTTKSSSPT